MIEPLHISPENALDRAPGSGDFMDIVTVRIIAIAVALVGAGMAVYGARIERQRRVEYVPTLVSPLAWLIFGAAIAFVALIVFGASLRVR